MTEHYDALETREPGRTRGRAVRAAAGRAAQGDGGAGLCGAPWRHRSRRDHQPGRAGAAAAVAQVGPACPAQGRAAVRRIRRRACRIVRAAVHLARSDLRAGGDPCRSLARRAGAVRGGLPAGRRGAEHLQLSSDAGRLHLRCLRARARLRGDSGRSRQYRGAIRTDRGLSPGRLQRHAGFPQDPARRRCKRRARRVLDQARAGVGRGVSEIAAGGNSFARRRCLSGVRHRRSRHRWPSRPRRTTAWSSTKT